MINKKNAKTSLIVLISVFVVLAICAGTFVIYIYSFNHTKREFDSGYNCDDFTVNIAERTGQTDSWPKNLTENGEIVKYKGTIYDVTLDNIGKCTISKWNLRININMDMYLNNAWCGKFEIHQNVGGEEKVQTVDLRNYSQNELTLDFIVADPDLLIPLHPGDYLVYCPDFEADEYPVLSGDSEKLKQVVFGVIFYDRGDGPIVFDDLHMDYYLQQNWLQSPITWTLSICFFIWLIALVAFASVEINMKKAHIRFEQDERIIQQSIGVFTHFFEAKDIYTTGHSQRVAEYTRLLAKKAGLSEDQQRQDYYIALMHDCGKCYIPDEILKKPGRLTDEEYEIIKSHTVKGAEMLEQFESIANIRDGVLYHHERYDGKGYPSGLSGEDIPLIAIIICIADSFDAMNSHRCYRDTLTKEYIISEIKTNRGKQFDPKLADLFLEMIGDGEIKFSNNNGDN